MYFEVGDRIKLKKAHPCGSHEWDVLRVGIDFRLQCVGCGHGIMTPRTLVEKNCRGVRHAGETEYHRPEEKKPERLDTILFDLDGTLLPMDQDEFVQKYFDGLCEVMARQGWDPDRLRRTVWAGTMAMLKNNGERTNEERFWELFEGQTGRRREDVEGDFLHFYEHEFQEIGRFIEPVPAAAQAVGLLRDKGYRVVLATNPLFPRVATWSRIRWAGLRPEDFDLITTYENSRYCKPSPAYYKEVLDAVGSRPERCLMAGNDTEDDMGAAALGMQVYLVSDHLVDRKGLGTAPFRHGGLKQFREWAQGLSPAASALS